MSNPAVEIIEKAVGRIMAAMKEGHFTEDDLETIKKVFQAGIESTDSCLSRGPEGSA